MRAVQISRFGGSDAVEFTKDAPVPSLRSSQVLVAVKAASINPADGEFRSGAMGKPQSLEFPVTLGGDFSGIVEKARGDVPEFREGEEVYGQAIVLNGGSGSFADFVVANAANMYHKPRRADFLEAAALPLAGASAVQALEDHIQLKVGQEILIHGGAGGIGSVALQIAKSIGAVVATTVSDKNFGFVKKLGADIIIDYQAQRFENAVRDCDAVLDTVGGDTYRRSFEVLKRGGVIVSMVESPDEEFAKQFGVKAIGQFTIASSDRLRRLSERFESGALQVFIDRVFALEQAREAFDHLKTAHTRGKVVLRVA